MFSQTNGICERFHRTMKDDFYHSFVTIANISKNLKLVDKIVIMQFRASDYINDLFWRHK